MEITTFILKKLLAPQAFVFERSLKDPMGVQKKLLFRFLKKNKDTVYGREHSFGKIDSIDEYRRRVPIRGYEELRPYVERSAAGEKNILTKESPFLFATTSGTTGVPKLIPVTKYSRNMKSKAMNLWLYYILRDHPDLFTGKVLAIVSPEIEKCTISGLPCGAETGHAYKNLPYFVRKFYVLPYSVLEIKDYLSKYYCILRLAIEADVSTIAAVNPSTILLLCHKTDIFADRIIEDIEKGTLQKNITIEDKTRREIEKRLKPNPRRASELRALLKEHGKLLPRHFWPNLKLIESWKAGTLGLYLREFPKYFGDVPVRDFGYIASEARCSIPMDDEKCCGILAINANFYEFIPKEDRDRADKRIFLCDELELGKEYFVLITTPGGLYRYDIDDLIRVTGFYDKTPRIEFIQKGLNVTSITGEKLYESQIVTAVKKAVDRSGVMMEFFTACIQWGEVPCYAFLVEFTNSLEDDKKRNLLKLIDDGIRIINIEYETKRKSERLGDPILKVVKRGSFRDYRIKKVGEGSHDGQFKVPQLTRDMSFQDNFEIEGEIHLKK